MSRTRTLLLAGLLVVVAAGSLAPAQAATPKPFTGSTPFHDATPDPSGGLGANCQGTLPVEKGLSVKVPASGVLTVSLTGFTGDWALVAADATGKVLGTSDTFPESENMIVPLKKAMTVTLLPCNVGGTVDATVSWAYRYKKP